MVTRTVYFTLQCVIRYHNQCISTGNVVCGTTTSGTQQFVMRYHNQCISPGNVLYGTTTIPFHLAICHTVSRPVYFTWQCVIRYHNQCISPGNVLCGTTTSAFYLTMCHTAPRPVQPSNMSYEVALVVVPHDTFPGERYWSWYHMSHCQVKGTGCGTV
jgi:hypothetical protein